MWGGITSWRGGIMWGMWGAERVRWTHCPRGHEFTEENTLRQHGGRRLCAACSRRRKREHMRRKRAAKAAGPVWVAEPALARRAALVVAGHVGPEGCAELLDMLGLTEHLVSG